MVRRANQYGDQYEYWHGVDVAFNVRLIGGTLLQGGTSTGKTVTDNCEVMARVPEGGVTSQNGLNSALLEINGPLAIPFCHQETPWQTQVKLLGTYTIPRIDVQLALIVLLAGGGVALLVGSVLTAARRKNREQRAAR